MLPSVVFVSMGVNEKKSRICGMKHGRECGLFSFKDVNIMKPVYVEALV